MPRTIKAHVLVMLTWLSGACAPVELPPPPVAAASPPGVKVAPPKPGAPDAQVAGRPEDRAANAPPAPAATVAVPAPAPSGPRATSLEALRYPWDRFVPRARYPLTVELSWLESQLATTQPGSPGRPALMRRLADVYLELEATAARDGNDNVVADARRSAIKYYLQLSKDSSQYCQGGPGKASQGGTGCGDEVLYLLGYMYERSAQFVEARKTYFALVQGFPSSRYLPWAYLAFGEMFYQEAVADPSKWHLAEASYNEVLKYPPPGNEVYGFAVLRLGGVYQGLQEPRRARAMYEKLRKGAESHPDWDLLVVPAGLIPAVPP